MSSSSVPSVEERTRNGRRKRPLPADPPPAPAGLDRKQLLSALLAFKRGDFSARLPLDWTGLDGKIADAFNDAIEVNERLCGELQRLGRVVGVEGRIAQRASVGSVSGGWAASIDAVNGLIADLVHPISETARVIGAVARGDLSQTMALEIDARPLRGEFLRTATTVNTMVDQLGSFASEVAREVGTEGKLGGQADVKGVAGVWKGLTDKAPVDPQALKSKVSVFLELFRKSEEARRHAESRERHAEQLRRLADAALAIHGAGSLEELLKLVADAATALIAAHQVAVRLDAVTLAAALEPARRGRYAVARPAHTPLVLLAGRALADAPARPVRMTRAELEGHPAWSALEADGPPLRGWLAAPLSDREGRPIGWIQLSDKQDGDFTAEDETLLVQLAQMAAIAAENTLFDEAQEANRIKDQFLGTLSHELRTPLQSILSWSRLLREMPPEQETLLRGLEVIERNARLQTRLIDDLLDVSRILSGKLLLEQRLVQLGDLLRIASEDALPGAHDKGVRIEIEHADDAQIAGDPNRLRQVLGNLFSNALKFTPAGGSVTLRVDVEAGHAEICMRDTGKGIPKEFQPHLFERFRQADSGTTRGKGGLGIGLAIARHLVELQGGTIRAYSDGEGLGASFFVRFPLAREATQRAPEPAPTPARDAPPVCLDGLRILLVEDDADTRECLALGLRQHGAQVEAAASAPEAAAALDLGGFDVVLSDLAMPKEDGFSLVRSLRARPPEKGGRTPAAALSAHIRAEERARALLAGFDLHVAKPIEPAELAGVVRHLVERRDA